MIQRHLFKVFNTTDWINDDCAVRACDDGYIFTEIGLFKCPDCDRANNPNLLPAKHHLLRWNELQMEERREERRKIVLDLDYRYAMQKEMMRRIGDAFRGKKEEEVPETKEETGEEEIPF